LATKLLFYLELPINKRDYFHQDFKHLKYSAAGISCKSNQFILNGNICFPTRKYYLCTLKRIDIDL